MLPVLADGGRISHGARQHYCPSSPIYRGAAGRLVTALATRYADHPALAMWHVGNEFGCHVPACYCDVSALAFRQWLEQRDGGLEDPHRAWRPAVWAPPDPDWD